MDIEAELARAVEAQRTGNPGRARVCARRAAGWAIRAWYRRQGGSGWGGDAMQQLQRLQAEDSVPEAVREAAKRLMTKVDFDHSLPFDADPIDDARSIIAFVSGD